MQKEQDFGTQQFDPAGLVDAYLEDDAWAPGIPRRMAHLVEPLLCAVNVFW